MYRREAYDFIIWHRSIYLDIISNNYSHYLSDMRPISCSSNIQNHPVTHPPPVFTANLPQGLLNRRCIGKEEQCTWLYREAA